MNDTQIEKVKFFKKERDRLNARSRALSMSKVNCVKITLGSRTEGKYPRGRCAVPCGALFS